MDLIRSWDEIRTYQAEFDCYFRSEAKKSGEFQIIM